MLKRFTAGVFGYILCYLHEVCRFRIGTSSVKKNSSHVTEQDLGSS